MPARNVAHHAQSDAIKVDLVRESDAYYFSDRLDREVAGTFFVEVHREQTYSVETEDEEAYSRTDYYDVTGTWTIYFEMDGDPSYGRIVEIAFDNFTYNTSDW